jgi:hypothetical protein
MNINLHISNSIRIITFCFLLLSSVLLFQACESIVDFPETGEFNAIPVIEAVLTDKFEEQRVRITYSVPLNDPSSCRIVENAGVIVYSADGDSLVYQYQSDGWYTSRPFQANKKTVYTLEVKLDTMLIVAKEKVIELRGIDSVYYSFPNDTAADVHFTIAKRNGDVKYFFVNIFRNNDLLTTGSEIFILYDKNLMEKITLKLPHLFEVNDTVAIEFHAISERMFDYYYQLVDQFFYNNYFNIGYRTNPVNMFEGKALGYFHVSSVRCDTLIIHPPK